MARKSSTRGSVSSDRGNLFLRIYWHDPEDRTREKRWKVPTGKKESEENRAQLEDQLVVLNNLIERNSFFPCQEFPGTKIAQFCQCSACSIVEPLSKSIEAPRTLGELFKVFSAHEEERAKGRGRVIEKNSWDTKRKGINVFNKSFTVDVDNDFLDEFDALADYQISELTPHNVTAWLKGYQRRTSLIEKGESPLSTKYLNELKSYIDQALEFGVYRRWWRSHPLLEYKKRLIEKTKLEANREKNNTLMKPFPIEDRDRIITWYLNEWDQCPADKYGGKEKIRLFFQYHYVVIGFNTGMRSPCEMTALRWSDVNFERKHVRVAHSRQSSGKICDQEVNDYTKTLKQRYVPLNAAAFASFKALEDFRQTDEDWIFWNPRAASDNPLRIANGWAPLTGEKRIRYQFEKCLEALEIPSEKGMGQYRMRHTFVTIVLNHTDYSDLQVAELIGDSVETMKRHYSGCTARWKAESDWEQLDKINSVQSPQTAATPALRLVAKCSEAGRK